MKRRRTPASRWFAACLAGIVAGGVTLGVGEFVGSLVAPRTAPFLAVGNTVVDFTPEWLKSFAISAFGENDKLVLLGTLGFVLALLSAAAGILQLRRPPWGLALAGLLGGSAVAAALGRPGADWTHAIPSIAGVLIGGFTLWLVVERLRDRHPVADDTARLVGRDRRTFLLLTGAAAGLAVLTALGGRRLGQTRQDVLAARARLGLPAPADALRRPSPGVQLDVTGLTPFTSSNADFYRVDTALEVPTVHPDDWRLRLHGMVNREVELSFDELVALPLVERMITLTCVSNEVGGDLADNAVWLGCPLQDLIERAEPAADADMLLSTSIDGFTASTPLAAVIDGRDALLAVGMNGEPLPLAHGFPVRMVVPGLYGYVSATKWLTELKVTRFDLDTAYWTDRGWAAEAPIKTASRIDVPRSFAKLPAGRVVVAGVAWAQRRGVEQVEVNVDDGPWQEAQLAAEASIDTWRQWSWGWDAPPGRHTLRVRATDGTGEIQIQDKATPFPDGSSGWHSRVVEVV